MKPVFKRLKPEERIACDRCASSGAILYKWQMRADDIPVIRVTCMRCNKFVRWAPRKECYMNQADHYHMLSAMEDFWALDREGRYHDAIQTES